MWLAAHSAQRLHVNERQGSFQHDGLGQYYQGSQNGIQRGGEARRFILTHTVAHSWLKTYPRTCRGDKTRSKSNQEKDADVYRIAI